MALQEQSQNRKDLDSLIEGLLDPYASTESAGAAMLRDPLGRRFVHSLTKFILAEHDDIAALSAPDMKNIFERVPGVRQQFGDASFEVSGVINAVLARARGKLGTSKRERTFQLHRVQNPWASYSLPE